MLVPLFGIGVSSPADLSRLSIFRPLDSPVGIETKIAGAMRIPKIKFPNRLPKLSPTGSESKAAESVASNTRTLSSDVPRAPSNTDIGGNASLQPKRTPVSDQEIDAIMSGGCI